MRLLASLATLVTTKRTLSSATNPVLTEAFSDLLSTGPIMMRLEAKMKHSRFPISGALWPEGKAPTISLTKMVSSSLGQQSAEMTSSLVRLPL